MGPSGSVRRITSLLLTALPVHDLDILDLAAVAADAEVQRIIEPVACNLRILLSPNGHRVHTCPVVCGDQSRMVQSIAGADRLLRTGDQAWTFWIAATAQVEMGYM
jgi:hypothetical protein